MAPSTDRHCERSEAIQAPNDGLLRRLRLLAMTVKGKAERMSADVSSGIFRDIFFTAPMRRVFADENRIRKYLDIEAALARVEARLGIIPQEAAEEICRHCAVDQFDFAK